VVIAVPPCREVEDGVVEPEEVGRRKRTKEREIRRRAAGRWTGGREEERAGERNAAGCIMKYERTKGRKDKRAEGRKNRRTEGRKEGRTEEQKDGRTGSTPY
jgi:hypothetical protein